MEEKVLRAFLKERFYHDYRVNRMTSKARRMVRDLFEHFMAEPDTLPTPWQAADGDDAAKARRIADYIAGMTDRYAISEHSRLFDFYQRQQ
jgi:dGTPase